jgi:hypothetical protein
MQKLKLLTIPILMILSCSVTRSSRWQEWKKDFPVIVQEELGFVGVGPEKLELVETYPKLDSTLIKEIGIMRIERPRAVGRIRMGDSSWWALVTLMGPGEASDHWQYFLLPMDSSSGKVGKAEWLTEVVSECQGYLDACESWLHDLNNDGKYELIRRCLTYGVPNPDAEYCTDGIAPVWETEVLSFQDGSFSPCPTCKVDTASFPISEEASMRSAFVNSGHEDMLPR